MNCQSEMLKNAQTMQYFLNFFWFLTPFHFFFGKLTEGQQLYEINFRVW